MAIEKQIIGILAEDGEAFGKNSVFINSNNAIQYVAKSLMADSDINEYYTGYISSFEEDVEYDDEYMPELDRIDNFRNELLNYLLIFTPRPSEGVYTKMAKVSIVTKPAGFNLNDSFRVVPVFAAADDSTVCEWESRKHWRSFRDYNNIDEFYERIKNKNAVGSIFGYNIEETAPAFVIWKEKDERLFALGRISNCHYTSVGGIIIESNDLFKIDISDYINFMPYDVDVNPTITFIPESTYKEIEDSLLKAEASREKMLEADENGSDKQSEKLNEKEVEKEHKEIKLEEITEPSNEELEEIEIDSKSDELLVKLMDYHSQRRNLYYSMKDFVNVHTAIKCSNLVILSGLSGTGKSALVEIYARSLGVNPGADDGRLLFIPVRPSWNDDADLLGYVDLVHNVYRPSDTGFVDFLVNAQKEENKGNLYFVCFDEMNLARVEHYFSQFLSILERPVNLRELQLYDKQYTGRLYNSKDYPSSIMIGDNIRFIGTVNIDESTYHFSDKVLDRANVIELEVLNYASEWKRKQYASMPSKSWTKDDYDSLIDKNTDVKMDEVQNLLWDMHNLLQTASAKYGVGPRIVKQIKMYINNLPATCIDGFDEKVGLDYQIMQRVLTKVRGPEIQIGEILGDNSENNFMKLFDKYSNLSDFSRCRAVVKQKQKELESYGYCI